MSFSYFISHFRYQQKDTNARMYPAALTLQLSFFSIFLLAVTSHMENPVPPGWEKICRVNFTSDILSKYADYVTPVTDVTHIDCNVTDRSNLTLSQLRNHLSQVNTTNDIFLTITCHGGGTISLPWPMKTQGLIGLVVSNCFLSGKYDDFGDDSISELPDVLRVLQLQNSVWEADDFAFNKMADPNVLSSMTPDYDCGQDKSIEYMVFRNVSNFIEDKDDTLFNSSSGHGKELYESPFAGNESEFQNDVVISDNETDVITGNLTSQYLELLQNIMSLHIKCRYEKLRILDESMSQYLPVHHFQVLLSNSEYPNLEVLNYSSSGIREFPRQLEESKRHFPKIRLLDFSYNHISELYLNTTSGRSGVPVVLNLQHNNISFVSLALVTQWVRSFFFVDIRGNPLICSHHLRDLAETLDKAQEEDELFSYRYLLDMTCKFPDTQQLLNISDLNSPKSAKTRLSITTIYIICAVLVVISAALVILIVYLLRHNRSGSLKPWSMGQVNSSGVTTI